MNSDIVTDSISDAWNRTRGLLLARFDAGRWLKLGLIAMLGASVARGGGGGGYSQPASFPSGDGGSPGEIGPEVIGAVRDALGWLSDNIANLLVLAIGLLVIWIVLFFVILYVRSVFRFIFVESVAAAREPSIRASWGRHTGRGLSLLLWHLALGIVTLGLVLLVLAPLFASGALIASGKALPAVLGVGGIVALVVAILCIAMVMALVQALTEDFLVPAMYAGRCGVWEGWRHVARAWRGQFWNVVLFYLLKVVLAIGAAIGGGIVVLLSLVLLLVPGVCFGAIVAVIVGAGEQASAMLIYLGGPAALSLVVGGLVYGYVLQCLLLPISVFFQAYALSFVGRLDPALRTIGRTEDARVLKDARILTAVGR